MNDNSIVIYQSEPDIVLPILGLGVTEIIILLSPSHYSKVGNWA